MSDAFLVNRGSGENLTPEVHENTDLIAELMDKVIGKANPNGKYLWKKYEVTDGAKGDFIGYAVSDNETQYPDNGVHSDGLWYERTEPLDFIGMFGCTKTATDTFTLAQNTKAYGYNAMHSLGEKPKAAVLISKGKISTDEGMVCSVLAKRDISTEAYTCINIVYGSTASGGFVIETRNRELATSEITDNSIRFASYDRSLEILVGGIEYKLITMA